MLRIYLDTNVLTSLKTSHTVLCNKLRELDRDVLIVASEIHLVDLDSSNNEALIAEDVQLLAKLSKGHMLHLHEGGVHYFIDDLWSLFEHHTPLNSDVMKETMDLILSVDAPEYRDTTPLTDQERQSYSFYDELIPEIKSCQTMGEVMKLVIPYSMKLFFEPEIFRDYLKAVRKSEMNLSDKSGDWKVQEVFQQISGQYKPYFKDRDYRDVMNSIVPDENKKSRKLYTEFERDYLNLEIVGVASDKVRKKGLSMQNLVADIQHSYLASHCDILCTDDKNMKRKLDILSNEYGYKCDVLKVSELDNYLTKMIHHLEGKTFQSLVVELFDALSTFPNPLEEYIEGRKVVTINLGFYFLVYFNVCSFVYNGDNQLTTILLTRREYSISTNSFKTEIVNLAKRINSISDRLNPEIEFMKFEEIAKEIKEGINYLGEGYQYTLKLDKNEVNPYLIIR